MLSKRNVEIPISLITVNPEQPRKNFDKDDLADLTKSILEYGVLQPIIVKKDGNGKYLLIAGERRLRASKDGGLEKIPAIIKDFDDKKAAVISIVENVQRENLSYIEEAYAFKKLIEQYGLTQCQLADKIGKKQSTISNKLRIISLPMEIQEKLINANLTERHARALLKISNDKLRKMVLDKVIANNLNVKQTEKLIIDVLHKEEESSRKARTINYISYKIYLNTIRNAFTQIKDMEKDACLTEIDQGEYMEVKIIIPKNIGCFT